MSYYMKMYHTCVQIKFYESQVYDDFQADILIRNPQGPLLQTYNRYRF